MVGLSWAKPLIVFCFDFIYSTIRSFYSSVHLRIVENLNRQHGFYSKYAIIHNTFKGERTLAAYSCFWTFFACFLQSSKYALLSLLIFFSSSFRLGLGLYVVRSEDPTGRLTILRSQKSIEWWILCRAETSIEGSEIMHCSVGELGKTELNIIIYGLIRRL